MHLDPQRLRSLYLLKDYTLQGLQKKSNIHKVKSQVRHLNQRLKTKFHKNNLCSNMVKLDKTVPKRSD